MALTIPYLLVSIGIFIGLSGSDLSVSDRIWTALLWLVVVGIDLGEKWTKDVKNR